MNGSPQKDWRKACFLRRLLRRSQLCPSKSPRPRSMLAFWTWRPKKPQCRACDYNEPFAKNGAPSTNAEAHLEFRTLWIKCLLCDIGRGSLGGKCIYAYHNVTTWRLLCMHSIINFWKTFHVLKLMAELLVHTYAWYQLKRPCMGGFLSKTFWSIISFPFWVFKILLRSEKFPLNRYSSWQKF